MEERTTIQVPKKLRIKLKVAAAKEDMTLGDFIEKLLKKYEKD